VRRWSWTTRPANDFAAVTCVEKRVLGSVRSDSAGRTPTVTAELVLPPELA
jgi:hypothetical protein